MCNHLGFVCLECGRGGYSVFVASFWNCEVCTSIVVEMEFL